MNKIFAAIARYLKQTDLVLIFFSLVAALYGLALVYSTTLFLPNSGSHKHMVMVQIAAIAIGFIAMIVVSKIDYHTIAKYWKIIGIACIILFIITLLKGSQNEGSQDKSWLRFGFLSIQPAELIKVAFIVTFSKHYDMVKDDVSNPKNAILLCIHAAIPIGLVLLTKDMGMVLVYVVIFVFMLFSTNIKLRYFAGGGIALLIAAPLIWNKIFGNTQRFRILALFDPANAKYSKDMWQQNQGVAALSSGEIFGYGFLKGPRTQSSVSASLPERYNDMIFTAAGEELGLIGCLAIILIFTFILMRFIIDASRSKDGMGAMMCVGAFSAFAVEILVNLGMCLRILPVIGLTLPFYSSGGTSVLSSFLTIGLVLSVYMHRKDLMFAGADS